MPFNTKKIIESFDIINKIIYMLAPIITKTKVFNIEAVNLFPISITKLIIISPKTMYFKNALNTSKKLKSFFKKNIMTKHDVHSARILASAAPQDAKK